HYWVHVRSSHGYAASVTSGDLDLRQEPLLVSLGANPPIEITMRDDSAKIEGRLASADPGGAQGDGWRRGGGELAGGAWIYCIPVAGSSGEFKEFSATAEGRFSSPAMAPGAYRILAFEAPQFELAYRDSQAMRAYETLGQLINLSSGQTVQLELRPIPTPE
ncbi:MAG: hypothetical protein JO159_08545, partial [Acidobacteria bacterium]|nr:hypothetical protein [Acidobacteriota bacterium]